MTLHCGQRIIISGAAGTVAGRVEHVACLADEPLPEIPGAPDPALVAEILAEWHITHVATISYWYTPAQQLLFVALHDECGVWRDLRGEELAIDPLQ
jgi:hypothetical protein